VYDDDDAAVADDDDECNFKAGSIRSCLFASLRQLTFTG
jgi:hypothetical protein